MSLEKTLSTILVAVMTISLLFVSSVSIVTRSVSALPLHELTSIHNGIAIRSDNEFTSANGVISGSGTSSDPYVISNWEVDVPAYSVQVVFPGGVYLAGILIANTTAHVIIRNVEVHSGFPQWGLNLGIVLWNATNIVVERSRVWNGNTGVLLQGASNSRVDSNELYNLIEAVEIVGNYPISGFVASGNKIENNTIYNTRTVGVNLLNATDNVIAHNSISGVLRGAVLVDGSARNIFEYNKVTNTSVGVESLYSSHDNIISWNFVDGEFEAIGVGFDSNGNLVQGNEMHSLQWGINLIQVSGVEVSGNTIQANQVGINLLRAAVMNRVTGNVVVAHVGILVCGPRIGANRLAPPPNDLRGSDRPIQYCQ